jgi:hypothetical protein
MSHLATKTKIEPLVKAVKLALPQANYAFHTVCSKYTFGDVTIADVSNDAKTLTLSCKVRDLAEPILFDMSVDGEVKLKSANFYFYTDIKQSKGLSLSSKAFGLALGYIVFNTSLWLYALDTHCMTPLHSNLAEVLTDYIAVAMSGNKMITFSRDFISFKEASKPAVTVHASQAAVREKSLSEFRRQIRDAFS